MVWYNPTTYRWRNKKRRKSETGAQTTATIQMSGELTKERDYGTSNWAKKLELMERQPTIAFARILAAAPILAADWSIDKDSGNDVDYISEYIIKPWKFHIAKNAAFGTIDWGWQPFDVSYRYDDGLLIPSWYKPLLQQYTTIVVHENGQLHYLQNQVPNAANVINVHPGNTLVMSCGVKGTNWYGHALMANVEEPYDNSCMNKESMTRYGNKLAGAGIMISHPVGATNGKDNNELAKEWIRDFVMIHGIARPKSEDETENWDMEVIESNYGVTPYIESAKYYDNEFFRGLLLSERSGLEGQYGTKAESEAQKDFTVEAQAARHIEMLEGLNNHIGYITSLHYDNATAKIVPAPLEAEKLAYLRSIYTQLISGSVSVEEISRIDMAELCEMIGIPTLDDPINNKPDFDLTQQTDADGKPITIPAGGADETQPGVDPLVSTNVLNGAQITAAVTLLQSMGAGTLTKVATKELLLALGIPEDAANRMVEVLPTATLTAEQTAAI